MGVKTFSRGDIIFRQGDPGDCMFDIQSGAVDIYVNFGGTNEKKIAGLSAGDLFGEMSLIDSYAENFGSDLDDLENAVFEIHCRLLTIAFVADDSYAGIIAHFFTKKNSLWYPKLHRSGNIRW